MHNYNFPPYSTGETGRVGSPKRREIGHGALAERALMPVLPTREEFPYAIRQVSEALGSNGSTSMGSVCASTMSLLNAGVPLQGAGRRHRHGPGLRRGRRRDQYVTLTDILGAEDAFGDMDFKVAGTKEFVTALQLDTKLDGIPASVLAAALKQAREARLTILDVMREAIDAPGRDVAVRAADHHGQGPGGQDRRGHRPEGQDDQLDPGGHRRRDHRSRTTARSTSAPTDGPSAEAAGPTINAIANPHMPEVGERFLGTVVKTTTFGAFISLLPGKDGLLHISQIRKLHGGKRVENVDDVVNVGDKIQVEIARDRRPRQAVAGPGRGRRARGGGEDAGRRGARRRRSACAPT